MAKKQNKREFVSSPTSEVMGRTGLTYHLLQITRADQPPRRLRHKPPDITSGMLPIASILFVYMCIEHFKFDKFFFIVILISFLQLKNL